MAKEIEFSYELDFRDVIGVIAKRTNCKRFYRKVLPMGMNGVKRTEPFAFGKAPVRVSVPW